MGQKPLIIAIRGPIGSGKSTLANYLRKRLGQASLIDYDVFKRMIDHEKSSPWRQEIAFRCALFLAEDIIKNKNRTIF